MPRGTVGMSSGSRGRGGSGTGGNSGGDRSAGGSNNNSKASSNRAPSASALKAARWPESAPWDNEEHFFSVVVGNSHLHWAFHNDLKEGMKPALFWRTPPLVQNDLEGGSAEALSRHLPQYAHDYIFGSQGDATLENALRQSQKRPVRRLTVYICSVVAEQEAWLFQLWNCIPSRVYKLQATDFFSASQGCYEGMGCDRLATLRGAAHLYGHPALVLDGGTAATYTCTDLDGRIAGGGIGLGMGRTLRALYEYTEALPKVEIDEVTKKFAAAKSSKAPISAFASSTKDAIIVDLLGTFAKKGQWVIREWLAKVGVPQLTREDAARAVETIDAAAAATINDDTHKTNKDRQILVTGGDGEIWSSILQPNHSNFVADEAGLMQAWVDAKILSQMQPESGKESVSSSSAVAVKTDTSEEPTTDKGKEAAAADSSSSTLEASVEGNKEGTPTTESGKEGKESEKDKTTEAEDKSEKAGDKSGKTGDNQDDSKDKELATSEENGKSTGAQPSNADSNGDSAPKPNAASEGGASDLATSENRSDGKSADGASKSGTGATANKNGGTTTNDSAASGKTDGTSKTDLVDLTGSETKKEGDLDWKNPGYKVAYMKHLIHYGIASVILDKMRQRRLSTEAEMREAEANDRQQFVGQRIAKKFKQVDSQGDDIFRGTVVGIQKLADKSKKERSKSGEAPVNSGKADEDSDDWFLIHYDDEDREHVSRNELQEMMRLFYEVGEKGKDVPNAKKRSRQSTDQDKEESGKEEEKKERGTKDTAADKEKDGKKETPSRGRGPDEAAPSTTSSRGRKRKESTQDADDEDEEEQPPASAKKRSSDADTKRRGTSRADMGSRGAGEGAARSARKRGRDLADAAEADTPSKKSTLEKNPKEYLHTRVCKNFDGSLFFGTITNYVDEDSSDDDDNGGLWHVDYDDGDEEDFDERDLRKALKLYAKNRRKDKNPADVVDVGGNEDEANKKESSKDSKTSKAADETDDDKNAEKGSSKEMGGTEDEFIP